MSGKKQQVIIVTGASSGLGAAICIRLRQQGHLVFGTGRSWETGTIENGIHRIKLDVTDESSVCAAIEHVIAEVGRIDVLINNAGVGIQGAAEDLTVEQAKAAFDTNFFGIHQLIRAVLPHMRKARSGKIINISSIAANMGLPFRGFYSASKAAVDKYSEALNMELSSFGIHITCIEPGDFKSNIATSRIKPSNGTQAYNVEYERCMSKLDAQMEQAPSPAIIVDRVLSIVNSANPRFRYRLGRIIEKFAIHLRYWLPSKLFQGMLRKFSD